MPSPIADITPPTCPECGSPMVLRETTKFTYADGRPRPFWGCQAFPACNGTHGAHPDGTPLGVPGTAAVKAARNRAHAAFDRLWKPDADGTPVRMTRKAAYRLMDELMRVGPGEAHIGSMGEDECETLLRRLAAWERANPRKALKGGLGR